VSHLAPRSASLSLAAPHPAPLPTSSLSRSHTPVPTSSRILVPAPSTGLNGNSGQSQASTGSPTQDRPAYWTRFSQLVREKRKTLMSAIVLVLTIIALGPAYATMAPTIAGFNIAKWTAQKDFRETCFADLVNSLL
jgi:hypothetical protein